MLDLLFNKRSYTYLAFCTLSIVIMVINKDLLGFWMGFNIGLAYIPVLLVLLLGYRLKIKNNKFDIVSVILLILFILFFPNTFYVITDLIHIDVSRYVFKIDGFMGMFYFKEIAPYLTLFHIAFTLLFGVYAGVLCIDEFITYLKEFKFKWYINQIIIFFLIFSSSVAIYIGRFLRFFSWEIFNIIKILKALYNEASWFMAFFIISFIVMQYVCYYLYKGILSSNKKEDQM